MPHWGECEILVGVGWRVVGLSWLDARDAGKCPVQVCHVRAESFLEPACAGRCHVLEPVLDGVDATDELGRVRFGDQAFELFASSGQDEPCCICYWFVCRFIAGLLAVLSVKS